MAESYSLVTSKRRQLTPSLSVTWTVDRVRRALFEHELGNFSASAQLVEHMQRDDRVFATLTTRISALTGLDFAIEPADENDEPSIHVAELVSAWWLFAMPESTLSEFLRWGIMLGVALAEVTWSIVNGESIPTIKVWHPQFLRYDITRRVWLVLTQDSGEVEITPGDGWILWLPYGERSWMQGAVRALAIPWLGRQWAWRDWFRRSEVEGTGIIKAKVPGEVLDSKATKWLAGLRSLGREAVVKCPEGFDIEIITAKPGTAEFFEKLIASCDSAITLVLLGQNLTTQIEGGSFAAAQVHARVQRERTKGDAESLSTDLREQLLFPWGKLNISAFVLADAPWPRWDTAEPADTKTEAETLNVVATAFQTFITMGVPVDVKMLAEKFSIPLAPSAQIAPPALPQAPIGTKALMLRSGGPSRKGMLSGQHYVDGVAEEAEGATIKAMADFTARVLDAVESGESYEEIKKRMLKILDESEVDRTAPIVEHAGVLATLAGRLSVKEDL